MAVAQTGHALRLQKLFGFIKRDTTVWSQLMNHKADFNETFRMYSLGLHLRPINVWSHLDSRWPPQLIYIIQNKDGKFSTY